MASVRPKQYNKRLRLASEKLKRSAEENETQHNQNSANRDHPLEYADHSSLKCQDSLTYAEIDDANLDSSFNNPDSVCIETLLSEILFNHAPDEDDIDAENEFHESSENLEEEEEEEEDHASKNDKNNAEKSGDAPIYHGHSMPVKVSVLLILLYCITHWNSGSQLQDLLTLIGLHCMEVHPGLKSLFHFKQYFAI